MSRTLLRIDSSARRAGSVSRALTDRIVARLAGEGDKVVARDLGEGMPLLNEDLIGAIRSPEPDRTPEQQELLALSDVLVAELQAADTLVIGMPIYNFGVPASLKAWIDLVARAGVTFRYTETGPIGLLSGKRVIVAVASGGTAVGSEIDFATSYLRHVLGFLGLSDITYVAADRLALDPEAALAAAHREVEALDAAA
jgi:FMN-dependent NADH-azoreductase